MRSLGLPPWLRRGLEAGIIAALVSIVTLVGSTGLDAATATLPQGPTGSLLLAPAVLSLGVLTVAYPVAYAATRPDAVLGTIAAFLIGANATAIIVATPVALAAVDRELRLGVLVGILALGPVIVGLAAPQLLTHLGFGRRAGAASAIASGVCALLVLVLASRLG
jgi:hypothetical protein